MSIFEPITQCGCGKADCYFCWLRNKVYDTTAVRTMHENSDDSDLYGILSEVSRESGVSTTQIAGRSREGDIRVARQMFCYVARKRNKWKDWQISAVIKHKRCTVIHSCMVVETMLEVKDPKYVALAKRLGILEENKL